MPDVNPLADRLNFINLSAKALARLRGMKSIIWQALPAALNALYAKIGTEPRTSRFFATPAMMEHAQARQSLHWSTILEGDFGQEYLDEVTKVGEVHARIGLEPRWYIGGYALMLESLTAAVVAARWPKPVFWRRQNNAGELSEEIGVLLKAAFLDMDLAISVYLQAAEAARQAAENLAASTSAKVMKTVSEAMSALAAGDLTHRIGDTLPDEYARLREDFNNALVRLAGTLSGIQAATGMINNGIDEISQATDDLARRTEQQAANLLETTTALTELTEGVKRTAAGAAQANAAVRGANSGAANSRNVVSEAGDAMNKIEASSQEISQIIGLIDDIAFQTNLLALNAGVEAARAGDAGRGFAVVASEVRALAQRSAEAAKAIKSLISTSSSQVVQGVELVRKTGQSLETIGTNMGQIEGLVSGIANAAQQQSGGLNQVSEAVNQVNMVVQQNAAMVEEASAAVHSLKSEINELNRSISSFKINRGRANPLGGRNPAAARRRLAAVD
ncbi:methyl-accepting chemotaxis protein [Acidocella sp.]|uniref:methyl-accepting chemotaxis protein n=1 Tax=Acidocella sp. TaxID=50710 RepID=UPI0026021021|nr:methyl-accepting chemotaxis protein [Acidocella sp.]MDD2794749.1 methyl-accepting chemotaxis protein [Acidocella sp.]